MLLLLLIVPVLARYCPSAADFRIDYKGRGSTQNLFDGGWSQTGGGRVATKSTFNLLNGSVEFDVDLTKCNRGVNANIYTISPDLKKEYTGAEYCDAQKSGSRWCVEIDWLESNGNCLGQTTYHTVPGTGKGCTAWGCKAQFSYPVPRFHMKFEYSPEGVISAYKNGRLLTILPPPTAKDWQTVKKYHTERGALIISSQWVGWVPSSKNCSKSAGKLETSTYSIKNLQIEGTVVKGPEPTKC